MGTNNIYCIDSSTIIDLHNTRGKYSKDVFESLWDFVDSYVEEGRIVSSVEVLQELKKEEDRKKEFQEWLNLRKNCFLDIEENQVQNLKKIVSKYPFLTEGFRNGADPVLVSLSMCNGYTVITSESAKGNSSPSPFAPRIPDLCREFKVDCLSLIDFCRQENYKF